jgi:type I restriction enzyme S subunit
MRNENELPKTWEWVRLGDICEVVRGGSPRPMDDPKYFSGNIPFLKIADITKVPGKFVFDAQTKVNELGAEKSRLLKKGSLVLTNSATVCVPKFLGVDACIHDGFVAFQSFTREVSLDFLYHFFNHTRPYVVQKHKQGVTQVNLNIEIVTRFEIPLPPLGEQQRIVAKLEELFSELDAGLASLKTVAQQLKTYRQAVLKWAFEGKLTNDSVTEGALPAGWKWVKIVDIVEKNKHALKAGPFGSSLKKEFYVQDGYKIYGQEQVISGDPFFGNYYISEEKYQELSSNKIKAWDVLISLVGTVGKVLVLSPNCKEGIINPRLIKVSLNREIYLPAFFKYYFESSTVKSFYSSKAQGTTMDVLNLGIIKTIPFPLCPLEEQHRIVQEIESRLSVCDKLEETLAASLRQAEALRQSILKQAFAGKLVF